MQRKYLFLYLKTGGGHLAPARSVARHIQEKYSHQATVSLYDGFTGVRKTIRHMVEDGYRYAQAKAIWFYEALYALHKMIWIARCTAAILSWFIAPHLEKFILQNQPDKIVIFHFFLIRPVQKILKKHNFNTPVIVVVTDPYTAHPIWFLDKNPQFIVFSDRVKHTCIQKGIPSAHVRIFPFVLDEKFSQPVSPVLMRLFKENMGFIPHKRVVLIMGGGDGIPKGEQILKNYLFKNPDENVVIVCGKNHNLYKKAMLLKAKYHFTNFKVFAYVDFVHELIQAADVVVTKCGASTFMEILISGKIPVISNYIWEQEKGNMQFVCENKLGIYEKSPRKLPERINEILYNPHFYHIYKQNIEKQRFQNGTPLVSDFILSS